MNHVYQVRQELKPKGLKGISDDQINQHWSLYEGYVKNVNTLNERLAAFVSKSEYGPEYAEMKRRLGFEYDGMILHEHYFSALKPGQPALTDSSELVKQMKRYFGGFEAWKKEFTAIGKMRGVGWAILYYDPQYRVLSNHWITLHDDGHPAGFVPLLVMDVWEHAFMVDWGVTGRPDYIEAFFKNVDWPHVEKRFQEAAKAAVALA